MKILEARYPLGSIKGQKTPGRYIDGTLHENLKILAKNIIKDMTFLGVITSSTFEVGTGKSVFAQQFAEAYLDQVNQFHGIDNSLTMQNITFHPSELIERSFELPKYSVIILDEWEDLQYFSALGVALRQFFRKCRQLNLLILVIIPNFFQLPVSYAVSRSVFLVDVKFDGEFDRGFFRFFNFPAKKTLYLKGKREQNYNAARPNFMGRFADGYVVNEEEYRKAKLDDLTKYEEKGNTYMDKKALNAHKKMLFLRCYKVTKLENRIPTNIDYTKIFQVSKETIYEWLRDDVQLNSKE